MSSEHEAPFAAINDEKLGEIVATVLDNAPFGLEVRSASGELLYGNLAVAAGTQQGSGHDFEIKVGTEHFTLSLALDDSEQKRRENELFARAYFDELTGLPNRALMERSVASLIESGNPGFAIAFFDLDDFKQVNDYYGHDVGDDLLAKLCERLGSTLRPSDMLARLGGDEFAMLISPIGKPDELENDLKWLCERVKEPFFLNGHEVFTSASIGVGIYPRDGTSYETLRDNADRAMYRGKSLVKGTVQFFDSSIEHAATERARMEQRLRLAIRDKRVCCAYQPKVSLRTGDVKGVEVLMRWRDEDGAIQPPGGFLELAVELGLMDDLTHFILAETVASIDLINEAFGPEVTISVNIAARQAGDIRFMTSVVEALEATGFADRFMLELTEEAFLSKNEFQKRILPLVRNCGAKVSIDDFGVGYSSLSALADITADEVKVDRSFITDIHKRPRSQSILKAIEALGHSLGMSVIVEGVETFEEVAFLQATTRIELAQGYYFSQPILLDDLSSAGGRGDTSRTGSPSREAPARRVMEQRARSG